MIEAASLSPFTAGLISAILAIIGLTLPRDPLRATTYFALLCMTTSTWAFAHFGLLNLSVSSNPLAESTGSLPFIFGMATLVGVGGAPTYWFLFAAAATGRRQWLTPLRVVLVHIPFAYLLVVGATNSLHHLYMSIDSTTGGSRYGTLAWIHLVPALTLVLVGLVWMVRTWWGDKQGDGRRRAIVIGTTTTLVLVAGIAHVGRTFAGGEGINPAPALFVILAIAMAFELFRSGYSALQTGPGVEAVEAMSDAMMVLDPDLRIHSMNSIAATMLEGLEPGSRLAERAPEIAQHAEFCMRYTCDDMAFEAMLDNSVYWGRVRRSMDEDGETTGVIVLLTDLTELRKAQDALLDAGRTVEGGVLTDRYLERLSRRP